VIVPLINNIIKALVFVPLGALGCMTDFVDLVPKELSIMKLLKFVLVNAKIIKFIRIVIRFVYVQLEPITLVEHAYSVEKIKYTIKPIKNA
jgi:hypothetical protein